MSLDDATPKPRRRGKAATVSPPPTPIERPAPATPQTTPTRTFRLPGGASMTLSTDRVRARPALTPQVSFALGQNAIGLGLWGLCAPKGVNRFLGLTNSPQATQVLFGARELATGVALFSDPTRASALWARVAGDAFDIAVLSRLVRQSHPRRRNARVALGVVLAVTALDLVAAIRMSRVDRTGKGATA
ncbi:MAG: hypothetical protein DI570_15230 [Phenylobacterium zucineum]|nr:MAG: hypothetical protein DI570_15230 [Phenylobacterium zucineum]